MVDVNIIDKFNIIINFIKKNSLVGMILALLVFIVLDLLYGRNKKSTKNLYIIIIVLLIVGILLNYYKPFLNILDIFITYLFKITYFPSIIEYITMIIISIILQLLPTKSKLLKIINIWAGLIIEILFIFNIIALNKITIDLKTITSIYENDLLLSIFQTTSIIFMFWLIIDLIILFIRMFLSDKIDMPKLVDEYE